MSQDHSVDRRPAEPEIIELNSDERPESPHPSWLRPTIRWNHRLVPVIAGLGLAAVFASLLGEWSVLTIPGEGPPGSAANSPLSARPGPGLPVRIADLATYGTTYLIGQLAVIGAVALVMFGTPAIRHNCRILGIATAGGLLALLATLSVNLDRATPWPSLLLNPEIKLQVEHGRGLVMAYAGTVALGLALYLAGRFAPSLLDPAAAHPIDPAGPAGDDDRPWRHRQRASTADVDAGEDAPLDLTVSPITPFAVPGQPDER